MSVYYDIEVLGRQQVLLYAVLRYVLAWLPIALAKGRELSPGSLRVRSTYGTYCSPSPQLVITVFCLPWDRFSGNVAPLLLEECDK